MTGCRSLTRLSGTIDLERYASLVSGAARGQTPDSKFAGGHRSRVTPVPIPNTEVKPATADGTAWETVWESRSLPALFSEGPMCEWTSGLFLWCGSELKTTQFPMHSATDAWERAPAGLFLLSGNDRSSIERHSAPRRRDNVR